MNFDLSPEQCELRDGIAGLLAGRFDSARVREGFDRSMAEELAAAGVFSLLVDGFTVADAAIVFEELGAALVPGPLVWTTLAHGRVDGIVGGLSVDDHPLVIEHPDVIDELVVLGAHSVAVVPRAELALVPIARPLDPLTPVARVDVLPPGRPLEEVLLANRWRLVGTVLTAALAVGVARRALALAVEHASTREQFGRPIGAFQAVKHRCADMAVRVEVARVAVHAAAVHLDDRESSEAGRATSEAKALAGEAAVANARSALQVHGALGFTWEVDLHLLLKRAWVLDTQFGAAAAHADRVAATLG